MNFLKKGPELKVPDKMPDLKMPAVVADIYYELRERHLLPLVVVLIVGIVAVPIALGESAEPNIPLPETAEAGISAADKTAIVVAKSEPGLRDYKKRLSHLEAKDPFKDRLGHLQETTTTTTEESATEAEGTGGEEAPVESPEESSGGNQAPAENTTDNEHITFYSFAIDVRVTPISSHGKPLHAKPEVRKDLPELTQLPSRQTPATVFIGVTKDGKKALMLVSSNVKGIFGDNVCAAGGETCEMLAMEPNVPETFVYGGNEKVYRIEVTHLNLVRSDKLEKAPLGKPHSSKGKGNGGAAGRPAQPNIISSSPDSSR